MNTTENTYTSIEERDQQATKNFLERFIGGDDGGLGQDITQALQSHDLRSYLQSLQSTFALAALPQHDPAALSSAIHMASDTHEALMLQATPAPDDILFCEWVEDGVPCRQPLDNDDRMLFHHLADVHGAHGTGTRDIVCSWGATYCSSFKRSNLPRHIRKHLDRKYSCIHCPRAYSRIDSLHSHEKSHSMQ